jgi:DNA-directed RNA polymerase specialized sigma24 family protein
MAHAALSEAGWTLARLDGLALEELEHEHARPARVVVLRFFAGLAMEEIAEVLGISLASAERDWRFGRAWLQRARSDEAGADRSARPR